jgi:hypothetical protein
MPSDNEKRFTALKFYSCGDEAFELFQEICSLAYKAAGLGYDTEVNYLYKWAKEEAEQSKVWACEEYNCEEEELLMHTDMEYGSWR